MRKRTGVGMVLVAAGVLLPTMGSAQGPGVAIERPAPLAFDRQCRERVRELRAAGRLLDKARVIELLRHPVPAKLALPAPGTTPLAAAEVYRRARAATVRVGWFGRFRGEKKWQLDVSGGYAISADGAVVTCQHVLKPRREMRQGYLVAVTADGTALPVTSVLAACARLDAAIVRVAGGTFQPLPLNDQAAPGDAAYVLSDPFDLRGYFSAGIVNRFYWFRGPPGDPQTLEDVTRLRLNVSTDWAPGSSGAAVLDACGNALGHVAMIAPLSEADLADPEEPADPPPAAEKSADPPRAADGPADHAPPKGRRDKDRKPDDTPLIIVHEAVPARGVLLLVRAMPRPEDVPARGKRQPAAP